LNEQLRLLIDLQEDDDRIAGIRSRLDVIPGKIEERKSDLAAAQETLERMKTDLEEMQKKHRSNESHLQEHEEHKKKLMDKQLMVKTNTEYTALLSETKNVEKQMSDLEDSILEMMDESAALEEKIAGQDKAVAEERRLFAEEEKKLNAQARELEGELEEALAKKAELAGGVEGENLKSYQRLMEFWKGSAVVAVADSVCHGCHMSLPPQKFQEVKRNEEIQFCNQCKRIIYFQAEQAGDADAKQE
jgi:predicted  nucleic acid-binding Zn-ribbon protein